MWPQLHLLHVLHQSSDEPYVICVLRVLMIMCTYHLNCYTCKDVAQMFTQLTSLFSTSSGAPYLTYMYVNESTLKTVPFTLSVCPTSIWSRWEGLLSIMAMYRHLVYVIIHFVVNICTIILDKTFTQTCLRSVLGEQNQDSCSKLISDLGPQVV